MGRPARARSLAVWMNGEPVGTWSLPARGPQQFIYDDSWLYSNQFRPLSLSLPAGIEATTLSGNALETRCRPIPRPDPAALLDAFKQVSSAEISWISIRRLRRHAGREVLGR